MKSKNTLFSGGLSGKDLNTGKVATHQEGKTFSALRRYVRPAQPNNDLQRKVRDAFGAANIGWSNETEQTRQNFIAEYGLSAKQVYTARNTRLGNAKMPLTTVTGGDEVDSGGLAEALDFAGTTISILLALVTANPLERIELKLSKIRSVGTVRAYPTTTVKYVVPAVGDATINLYNDYVSNFGTPSTNGVFSYEVNVIGVNGVSQNIGRGKETYEA